MVAAVKILLEKRGLLLGCLGALSFLLYANCALNGFVFDDHSQIERNPYAHSFKYMEVFWGLPCLLSRGNRQPQLLPATVNFGFLVCYKLFGSSPYGFHLVNIFLNCIVRVGSELFLTM